jgi:PncC family amidohydrolase
MQLSVAESLTGGLLMDKFVKVSGASKIFAGGVVAYNIHQKVKILGVNFEHATTVNCVSARVAQEMAKGITKLCATRFGLATTGYAESDLVNSQQAYVCLYDKEFDTYIETHIQPQHHQQSRNIFRTVVVQKAWDLYRENSVN